MTTPASLTFDSHTKELICQGDWTVNTLSALKKSFAKTKHPLCGSIQINGDAITHLDSAGAWLLHHFARKLKKTGLRTTFTHFNPQHEKLLRLIIDKATAIKTKPSFTTPNWLARIGKKSLDMLNGLLAFLEFVGAITLEVFAVLRRPQLIRWRSLASIIETSGFQGLFIIALLSLMIGVVMTYQMGLQLRTYGANIFIVDLLGLSVLREFAPLLTAIMVAGRTGSAFTAQLGTMKVNQEIDALSTMGVNPTELLILPRLLGLVIALPLLTIWADAFGVLGGMLMSNNMLDIGWHNFLDRFQRVVSINSLIIGLGKAPVFALIISSISCFQGLQVQGSADSVGKHTTKSVVLSIFFIIVADALFSIILSKYKL